MINTIEQSKLTNILIECPELISSVKVGVIDVLQPLEEKNIITYKYIRTKNITKEDILWSDILISVRGCENTSLRVVNAAKQAGRKVIYFLDDDLLNVPFNLSCSEYFNNKVTKSNIIRILEISDTLWVLNKHLGNKYKHFFKGEYVLGKVPIDIVNEKKIVKEEKIKILYAGSDSHSNIVQKYISPVVIKLSKLYLGKVEFVFIGADPKIYQNENVKFISYFENYHKYKEYVKSYGFDIGIAVIEKDDFYSCKYYNKFLEYSSIGVVGIYTNAVPYKLIINDFENGLLTDNTFQSWESKIIKLIEETELRQKCLNNAVDLIKQEYNRECVSREITESILYLTTFKAKRVQKCDIKLSNLKMMFYWDRISIIIKEHKFTFLLVILCKIYKKIYKKYIKLKGI